MTEALQLATLSVPVRNRYFYGKLLDALHFQLEQDYLNEKRWLVNRLTLGSGVLAGLTLSAPGTDSALLVAPGVALDPLGREIVLPGLSGPVDVRQPTDSVGRPAGDPIAGAGTVTVSLAYAECSAEPVPVLVGSAVPEVAPSTVREQVAVLVTAGEPPARPTPAPEDQSPFYAGQDGTVDSRLHALLTTGAPTPFPEPPSDLRVVLATVTLPESGAITQEMVDPGVRRQIVPNQLLIDLITSLGEVNAYYGRRQKTTYVSGDAQQAPPGEILPDKVEVRVSDDFGRPVAPLVVFTVRAGGGAVSSDGTTFDSSVTVQSADDGTASVSWRLGTASGIQTLGVSDDETNRDSSSVVFIATATPGTTTPTAVPALSYVSGDAQSGPSESPLPDPLVVQATDPAGTPIAGTDVLFSARGGGVTLGNNIDADFGPSQSVTTDSDGRASVLARPGTALGSVSAALADTPAATPITFVLLALA